MNNLQNSKKLVIRMHFYVVILLIFVAVILIGAVGFVKLNDEDNVHRALGYAVSVMSVVLTVAVFTSQLSSSAVTEKHRAIGGSIPSPAVDERIFDMYKVLMAEQGLKPSIKKTLKFSTNVKAMHRLVNDLGENSFEITSDVFIQSFTCKFRFKKKNYIATSASEEMAICMAIKKAYVDNNKFKQKN